MDFNNPDTRKECVDLIQKVAKELQPGLESRLMELLNPEEQIIQDYLIGLSFKDGAWYRPMHNVIVPAAMMAICNRDNYNRDLVIPALLHDAGNSLMYVASTSEGADWENVDKRKKHMELGGIMTHTALTLLKSQGILDITDKRILELKNIVDTHDFPYLGIDLEDKEAQAHRCADRVFVMSCLSFYKDLIACSGDYNYKEKAADFGFKINPKEFLLSRMPFFYNHEYQLPDTWDKDKLPFKKERVSFNEGGRCEPPYTITGRKLVDDMFLRRSSELRVLDGLKDPKEFGEFFKGSYETEINMILDMAGRK